MTRKWEKANAKFGWAVGTATWGTKEQRAASLPAREGISVGGPWRPAGRGDDVR
jgi:hypothetical protein